MSERYVPQAGDTVRLASWAEGTTAFVEHVIVDGEWFIEPDAEIWDMDLNWIKVEPLPLFPDNRWTGMTSALLPGTSQYPNLSDVPEGWEYALRWEAVEIVRLDHE